MENSILIIERIILETLEGKSLRLNEIEENVGFSQSLLKSVLNHLINKGMLLYKDGFYEINWKNKGFWLPVVTNKEGAKAEIKELFSSLVNQIEKKDNNNTLKVQKVWLTKEEKTQLTYKLKEIDNFILSVKEKRKVRPQKELTKERQVIFYGRSEYSKLVNELLRAS